MQNLLWRSMLGLASVMLCCASVAWSQDDEDVYGEQLLPAETRLMFSIPNVPDLIERGADSSIGQMLADPDFQPFLDQIREKLSELSEELNDKVGLTLEDLHNLPQGEITFAIVEKPARKLNAILMLDYGDNAATMDKLLELMAKGLKDLKAEHKTEMLGEVEVHVFEFPKTDQMPYNQLAYFTDSGYLVLSSGVEPLQAVLDRWDGGSEETLATNEVFSYIFEQCATDDEEPSMKWYFDLVGLVKSGVGMVQGQNPQAGLVLGVLPILGLDRLKGMGGGVDLGVGDYESISKTFIYAEQPPAGVLGLFQFPAISQSPPKWVGRDSTLYMGVNWNVGEAYIAVESVLDSFQGPGATAKLLDSVAMGESGPGVHPKKDFLDNLTGQMTIVSVAGEPEEDDLPAVPVFTMTAGLKDADKMKGTLDKASRSEGFPGRVSEVDGVTVYEIPTDGPQNIAVAVVGSDLVISISVDALSAVIDGEADEPLSEDEEFLAMAKYLPAKTSLVSYSQQNSQMKTGYDMLRNQTGEETQGIDFSKLPEFEAILKYTRASAGYGIPDKKGALFVGFTLAD